MTTALTIQDRVYSVEREFNQVNSYKLNFVKEAQFALQLLQGNDYLYKAAQANPAALEYAIINLASIGISLNPALKEAYLVPRGGKICLDISYMGLVKLATDTGAVEWVQAEIVKKNDVFKYNGVGKAPTHEMEPFGDRGEMVGAYCVAKLASGEFLSTVMSLKEITDIRDKSSQASKSGPWVTFFEEMAKKSTVKRASKLWPKSERLDTAVQVLNEHEGIDFSKERPGPAIDQDFLGKSEPAASDYEVLFAKLKEAKRTGGELVSYLKTRFPGEEINIDELSGTQFAEAMNALESIIAKQRGN
jgi:recombination protein RecT